MEPFLLTNVQETCQLTADDFLQIVAWTIIENVSFNLEGRYINANGEIQHLFETFTTTSLNNYTAFTSIVGPCKLLNIDISFNTPAPDRGQIYIDVRIRRGSLTGASSIVRQLIQGYLYSKVRLCWPFVPYDTINNKYGSFYSPTIANPAAGDDLSYTIPTYNLFEPLIYKLTFTADANVANRTVNFVFKTKNLTVLTLSFDTAITASQAFTFYLGKFPFFSKTVGSNIYMNIPDIPLLSQGAFETDTTNIQAGDQWSSIQLWTQAFFGSENDR